MRQRDIGGSGSLERGAWPQLDRMIGSLRNHDGGAAAGGDADDIAAYAAGDATSPEQLRRLVQDPALRRSVAATLVHAAAPAVPARRRYPGIVALAAAAGLAALVLFRPATMPLDQHRALPAAAALVVHSNDDSGPPRLSWTQVAGADLYEVDITTADGRVVYARSTTDTLLALAADSLPAGPSYFCRIRARIDQDRWIASAFYPITRP